MLEAQSADCQLVFLCVCVCAHLLITRLCKCITYVCLQKRCRYLSGMPPQPPTHPTSLTAICPVINLSDTLCNIDCLTALHRITVHVCVCMRACVICAFIHLSFILLACTYLCLCDPNKWVCSPCVTPVFIAVMQSDAER